jgi:benzoate 4-monooxygenase
MTIQDHFFKEGTVLSVPSYTIHRNREVWGDDAAVYRPERWFERDQDTIQRVFNPFSYGPRCVPYCLKVMTLEIMIRL